MKLMASKIALGLCAAFIAQGALAQQDTLKIGALVTLSGPGAAWGQAMKNAAELAADKVNAEGGLEVGGKRYKVVVIPYDDKYQANEAVTVANRMIHEDKIKYVIGPLGSAPALAVQPLTEKNGVITMTMGFTPRALSPEKPYSFRAVVTTAEFSQPQIDWVVKKEGIKKVGGLFPNDESGQAIAKDLQSSYSKAGADLTSEFFERERVDFVPLLTRLFARGIDAIELDGNSPATAGLIVKQARELGFKGKIIRTGGPATADIVNVAGKQAANGMLVHSVLDPNLPSTKAYMDAYQQKYKAPMNGFSPSFYDATNMMFEAMKRAGTVEDTKKVRDELAKLENFPGSLGVLNWTGKESYGSNQQLDLPFYVAEIKDGQEVILARCNTKGCQ